MLIVADDRTGALETAGALSRRWGTPLRVAARGDDEAGVVDAATRHLPAGEVAGALDRAAGSRRVTGHKIDSLLRGNWATELLHLQRQHRRILMVPAAPGLGRVCRRGVVTAGGIEVDRLADARQSASTSRPADLLGGVSLQPATVARWLGGDSDGIAVCDAASDHDLAVIATACAAALADATMLISGPAAALLATIGGLRPTAVARPVPLIGPGRIVVVVGSLHPVAVAQAAAARATGAEVFTTDAGGGAGALDDLVARARPAIDAASTVMIVGGDTAAAVLGDAPAEVGGVVGPGMPWFTTTALPGATVFTKPGSFGTATTLVELISGRMVP